MRPTRIVVVGGGFAGFTALRALERAQARGRLPANAEPVLVTPQDYVLYTPLLPEVAVGVLQPRSVAVPLRRSLRRTEVFPGLATSVDLDGRTVTVDSGGALTRERWDRLVLVPGSVTRHVDVPGVAAVVHGVKTVSEALLLRDHLLEQLDRADVLSDTPDGRAELEERATVVVVGAGYSSVEIVGQLQHWLRGVPRRWHALRPGDMRWVVLDIHPTTPSARRGGLAERARAALRRRGVEIRLGTSVRSATTRSVTLTDGTTLPTRTLVWAAGVAASPLVSTLDVPTIRGRVVVDPCLRVRGAEGVWAAGDAAAVPDLTKADEALAPTTAQYAVRQGAVLAHNVIASLGWGNPRRFTHHDLGAVADLGGRDAVARILGIPLVGLPAKAVARAYHLLAVPDLATRLRLANDWVLAALLPPQVVRLTSLPPDDTPTGPCGCRGVL